MCLPYTSLPNRLSITNIILFTKLINAVQCSAVYLTYVMSDWTLPSNFKTVFRDAVYLLVGLIWLCCIPQLFFFKECIA